MKQVPGSFASFGYFFRSLFIGDDFCEDILTNINSSLSLIIKANKRCTMSQICLVKYSTFRVLYQINVRKLCIFLAFIISIHHPARSSECQIPPVVYNEDSCYPK
jgi:hypothetical protein